MQQLEFQNMVMVHKNRMYRFALSYMKNEDEAEDVVQDVMMKLWQTREGLGEKNNLEAWCMTLTRNKALDKIKRVGRKMKTGMDGISEQMVSDTPTPFSSYTDNESYKLILDMAENLPEKQNATFQLRDIEGFTYLEIAETLDIDINQVKVNIFRARKSIKEKLEKIYSFGK